MATEKMTAVKALNYVLTSCEIPDEVRERLERIKEQTEKKNSAPRKPSAKQRENNSIRVEILNFLRDSKAPVNIADIQRGIPSLADASNQKVGSLLRTLHTAGLITKFTEKRITYYKIVEGV